MIPAGGIASGGRATSAPASTCRASAACATGSWTSSSAGRTRTPATGAARAAGPRQRGARAGRARRHRHQRAADQVLERVVGPLQRPGRRRRLAGGRRGQRRSPTPSTPCARRWSRRSSAPHGAGRAERRRPGGEVAQIAKELASLNTSSSSRHRRRHAQRPDGPARPAARPALAVRPDLGREHRRRLDEGLLRGLASPGTTYSIVADAAADLGRPAGRRRWSPGGKLGALLEVAKPGGTVDQYRRRIDSVANR